MPTCSGCGGEYRWIDAPDLCCPACGRDTTEGLGDGRLADLDARLDDRLGRLDDRLGGALDAIEDRIEGRMDDLEQRLEGRAGKSGFLGGGPGLRSSTARGARGGEVRFPEGFLPDETEMGELRTLVFRSKHVRENTVYDDAASGTRFHYFADDPEFNAFAMPDAVGPRVVILGGLVREFGTMAIVVTSESGGTGKGMRAYAARRMAAAPGTPLATSPLSAAPSPEQMEQLRLARELLCAMVMYVIGHELGHVCYGHIFGPGYGDQPLEVCRNQERDADSFASSVIAKSKAQEHWFAGQVMALLTMAIHEAHGVVTEFATHPTARERLRNAVRSNPEAAAAMGLTEEMVDEIAPAPGSAAGSNG